MAVGDAYVFPGFVTPVLTQLFFPKPPTTFLTCFAEVKGENTPERKVASTGDRSHNHQVMSPTRSPLSHPGGASTLWILSSKTSPNYRIHRIYLIWQITEPRGLESFPKRQILHSSKLKDFADDNFKFNENSGQFSKRVEITVAILFSLVPTMYSNGLFSYVVRTQ